VIYEGYFDRQTWKQGKLMEFVAMLQRSAQTMWVYSSFSLVAVDVAVELTDLQSVQCNEQL
jgi:hypothetical protein